MKRFILAFAVLLACSFARGAEATTTVEVKDGTVVVRSSTGEVSAKTGEKVVVDGKQVVKESNDPEEAWKLDLQKKLQRKVSFEFVDTPLQDAVAFLQQLCRVPMSIDPKVLEANPPVINLRVSDMTLDFAMGWILRLTDLDYVFKDKAIFIGKKAAQAAVGIDGKQAVKEPGFKDDVDLRIYDVSDLTIPVDRVIKDVIHERVRPAWDPAHGTSIEGRNGRLVVLQHPEVHKLIEQFLDDLRAGKIAPLPDAQVLAVRPESDLAMISLGSNHGAKPGNRLTIKRGPQFLATAVIEKIYPDMCSARLIDKKGAVQVNDQVVSRVPDPANGDPKGATMKITIKDGQVEVNGSGDGKQQDQKKGADF